MAKSEVVRSELRCHDGTSRLTPASLLAHIKKLHDGHNSADDERVGVVLQKYCDVPPNVPSLITLGSNFDFISLLLYL